MIEILLTAISILIAMVGYFTNRLIVSIDRLESAVNSLTIANAVKDVDLTDIKVRLSDVEMIVDSHGKIISDINTNCKIYEHNKNSNN